MERGRTEGRKEGGREEESWRNSQNNAILMSGEGKSSGELLHYLVCVVDADAVVGAASNSAIDFASIRPPDLRR